MNILNESKNFIIKMKKDFINFLNVAQAHLKK